MPVAWLSALALSAGSSCQTALALPCTRILAAVTKSTPQFDFRARHTPISSAEMSGIWVIKMSGGWAHARFIVFYK